MHWSINCFGEPLTVPEATEGSPPAIFSSAMMPLGLDHVSTRPSWMVFRFDFNESGSTRPNLAENHLSVLQMLWNLRGVTS